MCLSNVGDFAGLALIVALCAGFILGLTVPASAGFDKVFQPISAATMQWPFVSFALLPSRAWPAPNTISATCTT